MKQIIFLTGLYFYSAHLFAAEHPCFKYIKENTCYVATDYKYDLTKNFMDNHSQMMSRECLADAENMIAELETSFRALPAHSKNAFCFIKKIFIVKEKTKFGGTAELSYDLDNVEKIMTKDDGDPLALGLKPNGFVLTLSKVYRFDLKETEAEYRTRILHTFFGRNVFEYGLSPDLPRWSQQEANDPSSLLTTLIHEIGHFVDLTGGYTGAKQEDEQNSAIHPMTNWYEFSWILKETNNGTEFYKPQISNKLQPALNFSLSIYDWENIIDDYDQSSFESFYALTRIEEDFAEQYMAFHATGRWQLQKNNQVYMRSDQRPSPIFQDKINFIAQIPADIFSRVNDLPVKYTLYKPKKNPPSQTHHCLQLP